MGVLPLDDGLFIAIQLDPRGRPEPHKVGVHACLQHLYGGGLVRLECLVVQCDHTLFVRQSLQGGEVIKLGVLGAVLAPVPEDPGEGVIPTVELELQGVEGQCRPLNKTKANLVVWRRSAC